VDQNQKDRQSKAENGLAQTPGHWNAKCPGGVRRHRGHLELAYHKSGERKLCPAGHKSVQPAGGPGTLSNRGDGRMWSWLHYRAGQPGKQGRKNLEFYEQLFYNYFGRRNMESGDLEKWVMEHAAAAQMKLYFRINGDVPLIDHHGCHVFFELVQSGRRVVVLHPQHLTPVAVICYEYGVQMVQMD
jgi:hypothetical protein